MELTADKGYLDLLQNISDTYTQGRLQAVQAVNSHITQTYWQVGRQVVEFEQGGKARAEYGKALISKLAADLSLRHGKGFSRTNLISMRLLYLRYPISQTLSDLLSWSHWVELLKIDDPLERSFYEQQTLRERWSVRELIRQKDSALFLRLAASKDKAGILQLATQGQLIEQPADLLREPYVFEFLKIPEPYLVSETQLETLLCDHLQPFLLELGKGFTFVGRQYRVTLNNTHYKVDLVFYHRIPWCTPTDITALKGQKYLSETSRMISPQGLKASSAEMIPAFSIVMTSRATIGECAINVIPVSTNQGFKNFIPFATTDVQFLYYLLTTQKQGFITLCGGSTFLEIGKTQLVAYQIRLPGTKAEQTAIAAVLSDMDTELAALQARRSKTQALKQAMMQELLTGRIRLV